MYYCLDCDSEFEDLTEDNSCPLCDSLEVIKLDECEHSWCLIKGNEDVALYRCRNCGKESLQ